MKLTLFYYCHLSLISELTQAIYASESSSIVPTKNKYLSQILHISIDEIGVD